MPDCVRGIRFVLCRRVWRAFADGVFCSSVIPRFYPFGNGACARCLIYSGLTKTSTALPRLSSKRTIL
nr:hypothetical protein [Neisseria meningitidis]